MTIPKVNLRKIKDENGYSYMMDYTVNGIRTRKKIGTNKRLAESIVAQKQTELTLGKYDLLPEDKLIINLRSLVEKYLLSLRIQKSSINRYKNHLSPFVRFIENYFGDAENDVRKIKSLYIDEFVEHCINDKDINWEPTTINRALQVISTVFNFAIKREYLIKNPASEVEKLQVDEPDYPEYFTKDELNEIWKIVNPFWLNFLQFIYHTGLRKRELINLKWDKVYLDRLPIEIRIIKTGDWRPKTRSSVRNVPLNKSAKTIIEKQMGIHPKYVFVSISGEKIHPNSPYIAIKRALKSLNLEGYVHTLRHTFASHLAMKGANIYEIKELLGHSKIEMTQKYAHLSPEHKKSIVSLLDDDNEDS